MAVDKGDLKTLWEYAEGELLNALVWKVTETEYSDPAMGGKKRKVSSGASTSRIYEALEAYREKLQRLYEKWKEENPEKGVWNYIVSPCFPRFRLPDLRGGSRKSPIDSDLQRTRIQDMYKRCQQQLKRTLQKGHNNLALRKRDIRSVLTETLQVESIPEVNLEDWQTLSPAEIALRAVAWHTHHGPDYLKKKISKPKLRKR